MPGRPENKQSMKGEHMGHGSSPAERVSGKGGIVVGSCAGEMGQGGVRFKMEGPILDHSRVRETIGKE